MTQEHDNSRQRRLMIIYDVTVIVLAIGVCVLLGVHERLQLLSSFQEGLR